MTSIAKKNNVTVAEIKDWNHLDYTNLKLGTSLQVTSQTAVNQKIVNMAGELNSGISLIAKNEAVIVTNNATVDSFKKKDNTGTIRQEANYLVKKGDSLFSISKQYPGVTISDLKKWNNISSDDLKPGMGLKIMR